VTWPDGLVVPIKAELIQQVEADHPGQGQTFGYQLMIERLLIAGLFRDDLRWLDEIFRRGVPEGEPLAEKPQEDVTSGGAVKRPYLSLAEIAGELGCSVSHVEALIEARQLPPPIRGGLVSRAALDPYHRRQRREPSPVRELPPKEGFSGTTNRLRLIHVPDARGGAARDRG
jgi:hypothetical protein